MPRKKEVQIEISGKFGVENVVTVIKAFLGLFFAVSPSDNETAKGFFRKLKRAVRSVIKGGVVKNIAEAIKALPHLADEVNDMDAIEHAQIVQAVQSHFKTDRNRAQMATEKLLEWFKKGFGIYADITAIIGPDNVLDKDEEEGPEEALAGKSITLEVQAEEKKELPEDFPFEDA